MSNVLKCFRADLNWLSASLYIPSLVKEDGDEGGRKIRREGGSYGGGGVRKRRVQ